MAKIETSQNVGDNELCPIGKFGAVLTAVTEKEKPSSYDRSGFRKVLYFVFDVVTYYRPKTGEWREVPSGKNIVVLKETNTRYGNENGKLTIFLDEVLGVDLASAWAHNVGDTDNLLGMSIVVDVEHIQTASGAIISIIARAKADTDWVSWFQRNGMRKNPQYATVPMQQSKPTSTPTAQRSETFQQGERMIPGMGAKIEDPFDAPPADTPPTPEATPTKPAKKQPAKAAAPVAEEEELTDPFDE